MFGGGYRHHNMRGTGVTSEKSNFRGQFAYKNRAFFPLKIRKIQLFGKKISFSLQWIHSSTLGIIFDYRDHRTPSSSPRTLLRNLENHFRTTSLLSSSVVVCRSSRRRTRRKICWSTSSYRCVYGLVVDGGVSSDCSDRSDSVRSIFIQ